jgi:Domain of unknown function (DUF4136)
MRKLSFALLAALATLAAGCSLNVRSDANHALLSSVHCGSYAWAGAFRGSSPLRNTVANPLNEQRLRSAIAAHLAPGSTVQPVGSKADCLVGYGIGSSYVMDPGYYGWGYGWGYGYGYGYYGWGGPYGYTEGIISVDLYDARSGQPMWHASADQSLYNASGDDAAKRIDEAVAAIFSKRPPGA